MKRTTRSTSFIAAGLLAAAPALAAVWGEDNVGAFDCLNASDEPAYIGTGLTLSETLSDTTDMTLEQSGFARGDGGPEDDYTQGMRP